MALNSTTHALLRVNNLFPVLIWLMLFPFVINSSKGWLVQRLSVVLENKVITYLGKISYSIYLSHSLIIILVMKVLSPYVSGLSSMQFLAILTPTTIVLTLLFSSLLYHFIEVPGIKLGSKVSRSLAGKEGMFRKLKSAPQPLHE
jgi:peptidoglycan/LPS O-acetylase OafA/YrhL